MTDDYLVNLARLISAELWTSLTMQTAREMFGKSYQSLGVMEKHAVDDYLRATVQANFVAISPEWLENILASAAKPQVQPPHPVGFQAAPKSP